MHTDPMVQVFTAGLPSTNLTAIFSVETYEELLCWGELYVYLKVNKPKEYLFLLLQTCLDSVSRFDTIRPN